MIDIGSVKMALYYGQDRVCAYCGKPITPYESEIAHRIPQRKHMIRRYGKDVIHHPDNLALVCLRSDRCNGGMSIAGHPVAIDQLAQKIRAKLDMRNAESEESGN